MMLQTLKSPASAAIYFIADEIISAQCTYIVKGGGEERGPKRHQSDGWKCAQITLDSTEQSAPRYAEWGAQK